jgi:hypothetical protein
MQQGRDLYMRRPILYDLPDFGKLNAVINLYPGTQKWWDFRLEQNKK